MEAGLGKGQELSICGAGGACKYCPGDWGKRITDALDISELMFKAQLRNMWLKSKVLSQHCKAEVWGLISNPSTHSI